MISIRLPFWLRVVAVAGVVILAAGAGFGAYRYFTRPVTLTVAVGSIDGEAASAMSAIASRLVSIAAPVRLKVIDVGNALEAAKAFAAGNADLAVVRSDAGDLSQAQAVALVAPIVALIVAPPGSAIDSIDKLKGHTVGVIGGEANAMIVDVLTREYDLARAKVKFRNIDLQDARRAVESKEVVALLFMISLTEKYLSLVRGVFLTGPKKLPVMIPVEFRGGDRADEAGLRKFRRAERHIARSAAGSGG